MLPLIGLHLEFCGREVVVVVWRGCWGIMTSSYYLVSLLLFPPCGSWMIFAELKQVQVRAPVSMKTGFSENAEISFGFSLVVTLSRTFSKTLLRANPFVKSHPTGSGKGWCHSSKLLPSPAWAAVRCRRPLTSTRTASGSGIATLTADQPAAFQLLNIRYNKRQTLADKNKRCCWIDCVIIISDIICKPAVLLRISSHFWISNMHIEAMNLSDKNV